MMHTFARAGIAAAILAVTIAPVQAQDRYPLAPQRPGGLTVSPFFEGWYANPDGSFTLSFGYFNRNLSEAVEIPIGPDNFIEPANLNGMQPSHFPPVSYTGYSARRERGVFTVTVPPEFKDREVVWTLRVRGEELKVPGRVNSPAYELGYQPMAMGSMPPTVRFSESGPVGQGPTGVVAERRTAKVGQPLSITFFAADAGAREAQYPVSMTWVKHQGPGEVTFAPKNASVGTVGQASTTATFSQPGEYMLRVRVDNHAAPDSAPADQCCWTNGYVPVTVQP
jgi:hypothetical protein